MSIMRLVWEHLPKILLGSDIVLRGLPADSVYRITVTIRMLDDRNYHDLFNLALMYKAYSALKPHDKLYALLNIFSSSQIVDYGKAVETVFYEMAYQNINKVYEENTRCPEELSQEQWHPFSGIL